MTLDVPDGAERLTLALHGYEDDPDLLPRALADRVPLLRAAVAAPVGPTVGAGGQAWFPSNPGDEGPPLGEVLDTLASSVREVCARHGLDAADVTVVGWSQGAATALALALRSISPQAIEWRPRRVIGLATWLVNEPDVTWDLPAAAARGTEVVLVHGSHDEVVPVEQGRSAARVLERHGIEVTWVECDAGHDLPALLDAGREWLLTGE